MFGLDRRWRLGAFLGCYGFGAYKTILVSFFVILVMRFRLVGEFWAEMAVWCFLRLCHGGGFCWIWYFGLGHGDGE